MAKHPFDYGDKEVSKAAIEGLFLEAGLNEEEREMLYLRFVDGRYFSEIAEIIGEKYHGRTKDDGWWWGTARYRLNLILKRLHFVATKQAKVGEIPQEADPK